MCTARAMRAPQGERGPAKGSPPSGPGSGAAMQTASVGVPEQSSPASRRAWTLASVAVATALTRAASERATGSPTTMLTVPGRCGVRDSVPGAAVSGAGNSRAAVSGAANSGAAVREAANSGAAVSGAAAQPRTPRPVVTVAVTPPSWPVVYAATSAAVISPAPGPVSPSAAAISARWRSGSRRG
ncbi:hypothetical protein AN221_09030 [Streptomyces nanshensis]|uniref:Uncharacterized protein n=1 Tax=Streptomyces nanshensis TaxID=518642 RepID=A0A1E7LY31_9ACTN|nr:hypothetical protein AN221_09030 [Streptomyces nanshensis]